MDILKGHLLEWGRLLTKHIRRGAGSAYWKEGSKTNHYGNAGSRRSLVNCLLDEKIFNTWDLSRSKEELGNARGRGAGMSKLGGKNRSVQSNPVKDEP